MTESAAMTEIHLREYRRLILDSIRKRDGTPIPNGTLEHATILMEAFFKTASDKIRILTGELNPRVYGTPEVVSLGRQFLANSDHRLEIIFEGNVDEHQVARHPLLSALGPGAKVTLWRLNPKFRDYVVAHFALMDNDSYRFEADKSKSSAVASFGDKEFAKVLIELFDVLKNKVCTELRLRAFA